MSFQSVRIVLQRYSHILSSTRMSQTANGWIKSAHSGTKFVAAFTIHEILYNFTGDLSPSVPDFSANVATLKYDNVGELTTTREFSGQVGITHIILNIVNSPVISGTLDLPISPASTVSGSGTWTQNWGMCTRSIFRILILEQNPESSMDYEQVKVRERRALGSIRFEVYL